MASGLPWNFTQIGGSRPGIILDGWAAPFGRPRKGELVDAGVGVRRSITRYPGENGKTVTPTIHSFGLEYKPFQLHGRWMDNAMGGAGMAQYMVLQWKQLIADQLPVKARWGDVLSYTIFVHELQAKFESDTQVVWRLDADVLVDDQRSSPPAPSPAPRTPVDMITEMAGMTNFAPLSVAFRQMVGQFSNAFDTLLLNIQQPFAELAATAEAIQDFETALASDLGKIGTTAQVIGLYVEQTEQMSDFLVANVVEQNATGQYAATDMTSMMLEKTAADAQAENLAALIADMQLQVERVSLGTTTRSYVVQLGDTWQSISIQFFGDPSAAQAIRDLNGIRYGQRPQPGSTIKIPAHE